MIWPGREIRLWRSKDLTACSRCAGDSDAWSLCRVYQMTRTMLWQRRVRKLPRVLVETIWAKLRKGRNRGSAWVRRQIIIIGIYGVLLGGSPKISTLACTWPNVSCEQLQAETRLWWPFGVTQEID